jgi:hypothetical protein
MEPDFEATQPLPGSQTHWAARHAPTLSVVAMAVVALAAAVMTTRRDTADFDSRMAATPPQQQVVHAPPLNSMGAGPACRACGMVESVAAVNGAKGFQMRIRMDDGTLRTVEQRGAMPAGTRVMVDGASVKLMPAG